MDIQGDSQLSLYTLKTLRKQMLRFLQVTIKSLIVATTQYNEHKDIKSNTNLRCFNKHWINSLELL